MNLPSTVFGVGDRSEAFARAGWTGEDFSEMDLPLDTLSSQLNRLAKQHRAYPILHYYHGRRPAESSATAVAVFDDALTLLRFGVPAERRPNSALVEASRSSVEEYLETTHSVLARPADETPPRPDLQRLRDAGVPAVADAEFDRSLDDVVDRRRKLLGLVESDARQWPARDDE